MDSMTAIPIRSINSVNFVRGTSKSSSSSSADLATHLVLGYAAMFRHPASFGEN
jgi:hypothetical protein